MIALYHTLGYETIKNLTNLFPFSAKFQSIALTPLHTDSRMLILRVVKAVSGNLVIKKKNVKSANKINFSSTFGYDQPIVKFKLNLIMSKRITIRQWAILPTFLHF